MKDAADAALAAQYDAYPYPERDPRDEAKRLIRDVTGEPIDAPLLADTARRIAEVRVSPEGREGIAAFLEKRKAAWLSH